MTTIHTTATASALSPERKEALQSMLESLIKHNYDSVGIYETAADLLHNDQYAEICRDFVAQRKRFIDELAQMLNHYGATAQDQESIGGLMQDAWMNVKNLVGGEDKAIITECDRNDEQAIEFYHSALNDDFPEDVDMLLRQQFALLKGAHERIHRLAAALQQN